MANRWLPNGASYITAATLGNLITSNSLRIVSQVTSISNTVTGHWCSQSVKTFANREFGISFNNGTMDFIFGGGAGGNNVAFYTFTGTLSGELDFRLDIATGVYVLKIDGKAVAIGVALQNTTRVDGALFRIGARADDDVPTGTTGASILSAGAIGDTQVYVDDVLVRDYQMPTTGSTVTDAENAQDGTLQAGTGGAADWDTVADPPAPADVNKWLPNGSSYITAPALSNLLLAGIIQVSMREVVWDRDVPGYVFSVAGATSADRELALLSFNADDVGIILGGTSTTIAAGAVVSTGDLDFIVDMQTGAYSLIVGGVSVGSGTAPVGANRLDGTLFRIGARADDDIPGSTGGAFFTPSGNKFSDTRVWIDGVLARDYEMPTTGSNVPEVESGQDGTLQAGTGGTADWEAAPVAPSGVVPVIMNQLRNQGIA